MADAGVTQARECIRTYKSRLARSLAAVINILDPDIIVLGGGLSNITELYSGLMPMVAQYAFSDSDRHTDRACTTRRFERRTRGRVALASWVVE